MFVFLIRMVMVLVLCNWLSLTCTASSLRPSSRRLHQSSEDDISPSRVHSRRRVSHVHRPDVTCSCWLLRVQSSQDLLTCLPSLSRPDSGTGACEDVHRLQILLHVCAFRLPECFYFRLKEIEKSDRGTKISFDHALPCVYTFHKSWDYFTQTLSMSLQQCLQRASNRKVWVLNLDQLQKFLSGVSVFKKPSGALKLTWEQQQKKVRKLHIWWHHNTVQFCILIGQDCWLIL